MLRISEVYRRKFGCKVYKLSLDGGFTCPNRDGTVGTGGCTFCSSSGSGDFAAHGSPEAQLAEAKRLVDAKNKGGKYIAYFQSFTSTYAPVPVLEGLYRRAIEPEDVVGLAIGTRPDCVGGDVIALLQKINEIKPVSVELGLQTICDETAERFHRGYRTEVYYDAVRRLKEANLEVVTHIILGLPGETADMAVATTKAAVEAGTDGVKFHLLHVLRGTQLEKEYAEGKFSCLSMDEYGKWLKACIAVLPPNVAVHRITGDGAKKDLIAPLWSADKKRVLNYLNRVLEE